MRKITKFKTLAALLAPALMLGAGAAAQDAKVPAAEEARIPFASTAVRNFQPDREGFGLYVQDNRRDWYYARFYSRCDDLNFTARIGFRNYPGSETLERGSTVIAGDEECRIASLVRSGPPPEKSKAKKPGAS